VEQSRSLREGSDEDVTKNRIANAIATLAAVVGMVLVITGAGHRSGGGDSAPRPPAPPSQVAPAVPGQGQPGVPVRTPAPAPDDDGGG
jgi:hypothetical protein